MRCVDAVITTAKKTIRRGYRKEPDYKNRWRQWKKQTSGNQAEKDGHYLENLGAPDIKPETKLK